jgi:hypothetical protein
MHRSRSLIARDSTSHHGIPITTREDYHVWLVCSEAILASLLIMRPLRDDA